MTLTIELPDTLATEFIAPTTEEERNAFFAEAVAYALAPLSKKEQEGKERLLDALRAEHDPEKEPERDAAECRAAVSILSELNFGDISRLLSFLALWKERKVLKPDVEIFRHPASWGVKE